MEDNYDITTEFNDLQEEKNEINKKRRELDIKQHEMIRKITKRAVFNIGILYVIAKLMSYKEGKNYKPITYKRYNRVLWYPPTYYDTICVGISDEENIQKFLESKSDNIDKFLGLNYGYELFTATSNAIRSYQDENTDNWILKDFNPNEYNINSISFRFILNKFNIIPASEIRYASYNFEDFDYVQDFIFYLFNLQCNYSKKLTIEEMQYALKDFIKLQETKTQEKRIH